MTRFQVFIGVALGSVAFYAAFWLPVLLGIGY